MNDSRQLPASRHMRLHEIKIRVDTSSYVVDPTLVADAVLRRDGLCLLGPPVSPSGARSPSAHGDRERHAS